MIDPEELFQPIVAESRAAREPVALIEARARRRMAGRRVRRRIATALTIVSVVAAAAAVVSFRDRTSPAPASGAATSTPSPNSRTTSTGSVVYPPYPPNAIQWAYRGTLMLEGRDTVDIRAYRAWHAAHGVTEPGSGAPVLPLWSGQIVSASVFVFETGTNVNNQPTPFVALYVEQAGVGRILADDVPPLNVPALSWTFTVDGTDYTLVLGPGGATISSPSPAPPVAAHGNGWVVYRTDRNNNPQPRFVVRVCPRCKERAVVSLPVAKVIAPGVTLNGLPAGSTARYLSNPRETLITNGMTTIEVDLTNGGRVRLVVNKTADANADLTVYRRNFGGQTGTVNGHPAVRGFSMSPGWQTIVWAPTATVQVALHYLGMDSSTAEQIASGVSIDEANLR
jgi:hypothetical protein